MNIVFDHQIFCMQQYGGVSRYFYELAKHIARIPEYEVEIFAPFFTTKSSFKKKPNTGIGMYLMLRVIEETHKGKIWFESEYMKGTTVIIELPGKKEPGNNETGINESG